MLKTSIVSLFVLGGLACHPTPRAASNILKSDLLSYSYLEYAISRTGQFDLDCKNVVVMLLPTNSWGVEGCGRRIRYYFDVEDHSRDLCVAIGKVTSNWFDRHCYLVPY